MPRPALGAFPATPSPSPTTPNRIFGEDCKTFEVYESKTKNINRCHRSRLQCGKTHTIRGSATEPGVIPLAVRKEEKRRDTWCPGKLAMETLAECGEVFGIDQLNNDDNTDHFLSKQSQETCGIHDCEEVNVLQKELRCLSKEREGLLIRLKELPELSNDSQSLNNQLRVVTMERDKLVTQIQEQQKLAIEEESLNKHYNALLLEAKFQVEELTRRISSMELKTHKDQVENSADKAKLRMRLRGAQAKLEAFRSSYKDALDESNHMNSKYEEATVKLKDLLASKGVEVLSLK